MPSMQKLKRKKDQDIRVEIKRNSAELQIIENGGIKSRIVFDKEAVSYLAEQFQEADDELSNDKGRKRKGSNRFSRSNVVHNRKWQILDILQKHEPLTRKQIAEKNGLKKSNQIDYILSRLDNQGYVDKKENDVYPESNARQVFVLGKTAESFLREYNGFLHPDNPYDPGPDNERKEEVLKKRRES